MKKLILTLALLLSAVPAFALTRGEIREQVRYYINDTTDTVNAPTFGDAILNTRINIAQTNIAIFTRCLYGRVLITPVENQGEYRLPDDCIVLDRVSFLSVQGSTVAYRKLERNTMGGLDTSAPTWESYPAGLPTKYYERRNFLGLVPAPSSAYAATKALKLDYYKKPDDLTSDDQEPWDSDYSLRGYHDLIVLAVVIMCEKDLGNWTAVQLNQSEYIALLNAMKDYVVSKPDKDIESIKIEFK